LAPSSFDNTTLAGRALAMMAVQPVPGLVADLVALRDRPDSRPTLPTISVPVLVLAGDADRITPPSTGQSMAAAIPHARLVVVPRAGHLGPLENPRFVNASLRQFIAEVSS
jgi:pimeloyl-ACP methyl ester carboxylesterase